MGGVRLLGVDIGTTGVRAALFDARGQLLADSSVPCPFDTPEPGWAEIAADRWWQALKSALDDLGARAALEDVTAIGVVGQAPTAVLVEPSGASTVPSILWLDTRASGEASELGVHAYYLGPKLLWLSRHRRLEHARW